MLTAAVLILEWDQVVNIPLGRESGQYAVVINFLDDRFVMLADGENYIYDHVDRHPFKVVFIDYISLEIQSSLLETGRVTKQ